MDAGLSENLPNKETAWQNFINSLQSCVPENELEAWVQDICLEELAKDRVVFGGLSSFFADYVKTRYQTEFRGLSWEHLRPLGLAEKDFRIFFVLSSSPKRAKEGLNLPYSHNLNTQHRFERFVNGANTDIAFASALAVTENMRFPKYNPLFIYGSVGLGKTHLMQAIGNRVLEHAPSTKILYCSAESFTNTVIEGIRFSKTHEVRKKYRTLDLLLIDDIQFLENKVSTQEEFFHTLNELFQNNKQIVITADRYPREIKNIEERLISRFSAGMVARIEPPDYETRAAIIKNELERKNLILTDEVIEHIAYSVKTNVRDLIGVLTKLEAESSLLGLELTLESARLILKEILGLDKSPKSVEDVIKVVAQELNVKKLDILSEKRERDISNARQLAMYIAREVTSLSYPVIGRYFDKNHTSVMQACKKNQSLLGRRQRNASVSPKLDPQNRSLATFGKGPASATWKV